MLWFNENGHLEKKDKIDAVRCLRMIEKRKTSTAEFKREAVRLITEPRYGVAETARNLGIHVNRLRRWKQKYTANTPAACPGHGHRTPDQAEFRQLRDAVKRLRMERDILKKAMRCFGNEPR
jgi:transposase